MKNKKILALLALASLNTMLYATDVTQIGTTCSGTYVNGDDMGICFQNGIGTTSTATVDAMEYFADNSTVEILGIPVGRNFTYLNDALVADNAASLNNQNPQPDGIAYTIHIGTFTCSTYIYGGPFGAIVNPSCVRLTANNACANCV